VSTSIFGIENKTWLCYYFYIPENRKGSAGVLIKNAKKIEGGI